MADTKGIVNIHGKDYMTVSRRLELAHEGKALQGVATEVLSHSPVVIKATVTINGVTYTGISSVAAETGKMIERQNPYEVAETSAVGRALGFAGYGLIESVASADEVSRATAAEARVNSAPAKTEAQIIDETLADEFKICSMHEEQMTKGQSKSTGKEYWYHRNAAKQICFGSGYKS